MKMSRNNSLKIFMLFMGMLLTYTVFFQQNMTDTLTEISSESSSSTNFSDTDLEINEYDFLFSDLQFTLVVDYLGDHNSDHFLTSFISSSLSVWQPPKLVR